MSWRYPFTSTIAVLLCLVACTPATKETTSLQPSQATTAPPTQTFTSTSTKTPVTSTVTLLQPTATGTDTPIPPTATRTSRPTETSIPMFSSEGEIVFISTRNGNMDLYSQNLAAQKVKRLTTNQGDNVWPDWSYNGTQIAFESTRDGNYEIYSMYADGSSVQRLTDNTVDDMDPTWSPDGTRLAFNRMHNDNIDIFVIDKDGGNPRQLTDHPAYDYTPAWSPDGSRIAFCSHRDGNGEIYLMDPDGSDLIRLTDSAGEDYMPAWSPDGTQIAFTSEREGNWEIYVMDADGSNQRRLTEHGGNDSFPTWSPDGNWIAFSSRRDRDFDIYVIPADGGELQRITDTEADDWGIDWIDTSIPTTATPVSSPAATPITESYYDGVRVNFIFNEGFLITIGDQRILIDAIYKGHTEGVLKPILDSQPPFDGVDLILVTHEHHDHFDPELVLQYLQNNPKTVLVSTTNVVDAILTLDSSMQTRLTAIKLKAGEREQLNPAGIDLEVIQLSHGMTGIDNLGFIITFEEATLFHMGDMDPAEVSISDLQDYGLPGKQIDIAFVHEYLLSEDIFHDHISEGIQAKHLIPMHFGLQPSGDLQSIFPNIAVLKESYESWVLP